MIELGGMTQYERWFFDVHGYLVVAGVLDPERLGELNAVTDGQGGLRRGAWLTRGQHFLDWGPSFRSLIVEPCVLRVLRELCGPRLRLDGAHAKAERAGEETGHDLHGGGAEFWGDAYYLVRAGQPRSGLTIAAFALSDQPAGAGGFCCVPGSHKANFSLPPQVTEDPDHPSLSDVPIAAGDVLVFTDALTHGARPWLASHERRMLFLAYAPGMLAWTDPILFRERFFDQLDDDAQRQVFHLPNVERYLAPYIGYDVPKPGSFDEGQS